MLLVSRYNKPQLKHADTTATSSKYVLFTYPTYFEPIHMHLYIKQYIIVGTLYFTNYDFFVYWDCFCSRLRIY